MRYLRTNTAVIVTVGPFYDKTDGVTIETGLTITNERITLTADTDAGSAPTNILDNIAGATSGTANDLNYITGNDAGMMQIELAAADVNRLGRMFLSITDAANHVPVFHEFMVMNAALYDAFYASSGGAIPNAVAGASTGLLISGSNAGTTTLAALTVTGATTLTGNVAAAAGITITQSVSNGAGISVTGNGTGAGISATSGAGATGNGITATAASTNGKGIDAVGVGSGSGIATTGGATGHGVISTGGATSGNGIHSIANTSGVGIQASGVGTTKAGISATGGATSSAGILATGGGTGAGINLAPGLTGAGLQIAGGGTSGDGISVTTTSGHGVNLAPVGTSKHGLFVTGGNGGTSDGVKAVAGTGGVPIRGDITANITGTLATVTTLTNLPAVTANWLTAAGIADGAIDLATFAADVGNLSMRSGTAQAGDATHITLDASANATNDYYNNALLMITGGTGASQSRFIVDYVGATKVAQVATWVTNPDNTSTFAILPFDAVAGASAPTVAQIATGVWQDTTAGDFTLANSVGKSVMNGVSLGTGLTIAAVSGAVGSVTGLTASDVGAIKTKTDNLPAAPASTTNISAGTITTVTNLTNAPTAGDFTATMKTSIGTAVAASAVASVTGNVGGNVAGSVASVTAPVTIAASQLFVKKNTQLTSFMFKMALLSDHITAATGKTVTVTRAIDGGAFASAANTPATEMSNGWYKITLAAADLNGTLIAIKATATACDQRDILIVTQA